MLLIRQELKVRVNSFGATRLLEHHEGYVRCQKIAPSGQSLFMAYSRIRQKIKLSLSLRKGLCRSVGVNPFAQSNDHGTHFILSQIPSLTKHSKFLDYDFLKHISKHLNDSVQLLPLRRQSVRVARYNSYFQFVSLL